MSRCRVSEAEERHDLRHSVLCNQADFLFEGAKKGDPSDLDVAVNAVLTKTVDLTFLQENLDLCAAGHCDDLASALIHGHYSEASAMIQKSMLHLLAWERLLIEDELRENPQRIYEVLNNEQC